MNILKMLLSGGKAFLYVLLASLLAVIIGALTTALGYKPEGLLNEAVWTYVVFPGLVALIAMLKNWQQHKDDKVKK